MTVLLPAVLLLHALLVHLLQHACCRAAFDGDGDLLIGLLLGLTDEQKCRLDPQGNTVRTLLQGCSAH